MDILHSEAQQGQKHYHRLLLIPCDVVDNRQIVDTLQAESVLESIGNHDERIGVVTLSGIKHARNTLDITERKLVVAVFGTACGENHAVFRKPFRKFRIVFARGHSAVTACHDHKLADFTAFDEVDNLRRQSKHLVMSESGDNLTVLYLCRRLACLRPLYDFGKILFAVLPLGDKMCAGHSDDTGRVDAVHVGGFRTRGHDAVGGEEEHAVECLELVNLPPPCVAVVTCKVGEFLEERIALGREHLRVGVDVNPFAC